MVDPLSRRTALALGSAVTLGAIAGCADDPDDNDVDDDLDVAMEEWEEVEEFSFEGRVEAWTGLEPDFIEGEDNPTLVLIEGNEYDFHWVNADGVTHNMEIRDEDDEIIDDYQTEDVGEEGEETTLEGVEATEEMEVYICAYHETTQVGDIEVETD